MPWMRSASSRADECGVGFRDVDCLCYLPNLDCPEMRLNLLTVAFFLEPMGGRLEGVHHEFATWLLRVLEMWAFVFLLFRFA